MCTYLSISMNREKANLILVFIYLFNRYSLNVPVGQTLYLGDKKLKKSDQMFSLMMLILVQKINNNQVNMQIRKLHSLLCRMNRWVHASVTQGTGTILEHRVDISRRLHSSWAVKDRRELPLGRAEG